MIQESTTTDGGLRRWTGLAVLVLAGGLLAFHAPDIGRRFGTGETNPGVYFGCFARSFDQFGWTELRGMPCYISPIETPERGLAYQHHPPAGAWIYALLGPTESDIRWPSVVLSIVTAWIILLLLLPHFGPRAATLGTALAAFLPAFAFYGQVSPELATMPFALALVLATDRLAREDGNRSIWMATLGLTCLLGPWVDWAFGFFTGSTFLIWWHHRRTFGAALHAWWPTALMSLLSLGALLFWRHWATQAEVFQGQFTTQSLDELFRGSAGRDPGSYLALFAEFRDRLSEGFGWPVVVLTVVGSAVFMRRHRGLACALLVPAIANVTIFREHSRNHTIFWLWFLPLVAAAAATLAASVAWRIRRVPVGAVIVLGLLGLTVHEAWQTKERSKSEAYAVIARLMDEASVTLGPAGELQRAHRVLTNWPQGYPYYQISPYARYGVTWKAVSAMLAAPPDHLGLRYLLIDARLSRDGAAAHEFIDAGLGGLTRRFPTRDLPAEVSDMDSPDGRSHLEGGGVRLVILRD